MTIEANPSRTFTFTPDCEPKTSIELRYLPAGEWAVLADQTDAAMAMDSAVKKVAAITEIIKQAAAADQNFAGIEALTLPQLMQASKIVLNQNMGDDDIKKSG